MPFCHHLSALPTLRSASLSPSLCSAESTQCQSATISLLCRLYAVPVCHHLSALLLYAVPVCHHLSALLSLRSASLSPSLCSADSTQCQSATISLLCRLYAVPVCHHLSALLSLRSASLSPSLCSAESTQCQKNQHRNPAAAEKQRLYILRGSIYCIAD